MRFLRLSYRPFGGTTGQLSLLGDSAQTMTLALLQMAIVSHVNHGIVELLPFMVCEEYLPFTRAGVGRG